MHVPGMMTDVVTPLTRTSTTSETTGRVTDAFTDGDDVFGHLTPVSERRRVSGGGYEFKGSHSLTVYPQEWVAGGNRVEVDGKTYDIVGVDDSGDVWVCDLVEVVR